MKTEKKNKKWEVKFAPEFFKSAEKLFSNNPKYSIPRMLSDAKYEIKWALQRAFRGYDDRLTWDFHFFISKYFPVIIRKMIKNVHGYPCSMNRKNKGDFKNVKDWKRTLEKIAKGFEAARDIDND